tara:strand:+ start:283 stop:591 length:309 start_codon:yes stop_codon:yes gene_type:complete
MDTSILVYKPIVKEVTTHCCNNTFNNEKYNLSIKLYSIQKNDSKNFIKLVEIIQNVINDMSQRIEDAKRNWEILLDMTKQYGQITSNTTEFKDPFSLTGLYY